MSRMELRWSASPEKAVTAIGTFCWLSARRRAVTTISFPEALSSFSEALSLVAESPAAGAGSDAQAAPGTAAKALNAVTLLRKSADRMAFISTPLLTHSGIAG